MLKEQISASEAEQLCEQLDPSIRCLSLDCFDTLLWRQVVTPSDAFYSMQGCLSFKETGLSAKLRVEAEDRARKKNVLSTGRAEVTLRDIYLAHDESLTEQQLALLAEDEIAVEKNVCYAFPPVVALIRRAKELKLKVIIVSDTYLTEVQLRSLLAHRLPADVYGAISAVFCSCELGLSKAEGSFAKVLRKLNQNPTRIVHVGDNHRADFLAPRALKINAVHIVHYSEIAERLNRLRTSAGMILDTGLRQNRPFGNPFGGVIAASSVKELPPATVIGYLSLGPIFYAFSQFVIQSVNRLRAEGHRPKVVFLMRDGYLPWRACEAFVGGGFGRPVRISRFAANAASFRNRVDVDRYLSEAVASQQFLTVGKQLLLSSSIAEEFDRRAREARYPIAEFCRLIHQKSTLSDIFEASAAYRKRLIRHVNNEVDLESGDTLVFVDLGYTGTVQLRLQAIFKEELNVEICGRYLIALPTPRWDRTRAGLLDASWCDDRTMRTVVKHISVIEQLCTSGESSVVDYEENGSPLLSSISMKKAQQAAVADVQCEVLRFIRDANCFSELNNITFDGSAMRDHAMAELVRFIYLPANEELSLVKSFDFDINIGSDAVLKIVDLQQSLKDLRRRGLFFMEPNRDTMRMNYPAELRSAGIELSMLLAQQIRGGLDFRVSDFSHRREPVDVLIIDGVNASQETLEALPTFDGFWSLVIPVGSGRFQIGIQFGRRYQWLQIESADLISASALYTSRESQATLDATPLLVFDQMRCLPSGLYECSSDAGGLAFLPRGPIGNENYVLRIVFRPLVPKGSVGGPGV